MIQSVSAFVKDLRRRGLFAPPKRILIADIQRAVAKRYGISTDDIKSHRQDMAVMTPRLIGYCLSRELTTQGWSEIGVRFGGRDHTTIIKGHRSITKRRAADPKLDQAIRELSAEIAGCGRSGYVL